MEEGVRALIEHSGVPEGMWPFAAAAFCFGVNTGIINGDSPWNRRFKKGHFRGKLIPFGSLVEYRPPQPVVAAQGKLGARAIPGVCLGYRVHPGGKWRQEFLIAPISCFNSDEFRLVVHRVREVIFDAQNIVFPLREARDRKLRTVEKIPGEVFQSIEEVGDEDAGDDQPPLEDKTEQEEEGPARDLRLPDPPRVESPGDDDANKDRKPKPASTAPGGGDAPGGEEGPQTALGPSDIGTIMRPVWKYKGSQRPPTIQSELWSMLSAKQRKAAREEYEAEMREKGEPSALEDDSLPITCAVEGGVPWMPRRRGQFQHRERVTQVTFQPVPVMVARPVNAKEVSTTPEAQAAMQLEWDKLTSRKVWDLGTVTEWQEVKARI